MAKTQDYFKTFCAVSKAFGTTLDLEEILNLIVENAVDSMQAKAACLFLADHNKSVFVKKAQTGLSKQYLHSNPMEAKKTENVLLKDGYISIYDATKDTQVGNHAGKKKEGIASILVVPVLVADEIIGVLSLYTAKKIKFSADDIDFLTALAEQGGMVIERARLIEQVRLNTKIFHELATSINQSLDIKEILTNLSKRLCSALDMKGVSIRLVNHESGDMPIVASYGLSDEFLYKEKGSIQKNVQKTLKGETVVVSDVDSDNRIRYKNDIKKEGIGSVLFVPVKSGKDVIGIIRLFGDTEREFSEDTINLVNAVAEQGGLAIKNASMVLALQEDNKNLEQDMWASRSWF